MLQKTRKFVGLCSDCVVSQPEVEKGVVSLITSYRESSLKVPADLLGTEEIALVA